MNPEELLTVVEKAIATRPCSTQSTYILGIRNGEIVCVPGKNHRLNLVEFCQVTGFQMTNGFTRDQWNAISKKIERHIEKIKS